MTSNHHSMDTQGDNNMYNPLDIQVNRAHLNDLQREAEKQRTANQFIKRFRRQSK